MLEDLRDVVGGTEDVLIATHQERASRWTRDEPQGRLQYRRRGPLASDQRPCDVEAMLGQELVQVVAGDPPRDVRIAHADLVGVTVPQIPKPAVDVTAPATPRDDRLQFLVRGLPHPHPRAVVE